jgi:hypothetical protein
MRPSSHTFVDQSIVNDAGVEVSSMIGVDLKDEVKLRVNLESQDDALFVGTVYIGAPHSQPARVIFDTGSEHLAITGGLCSNQSAGKYHFEQESQFSKTIELEYLALENKDDDDDKSDAE